MELCPQNPSSYSSSFISGECTIYSNRPYEERSLGPLGTHGWLASEHADFKQWVARSAQWRTYEPGQFVYFFGDTPDGIYGLASGAIEVTFPLIAEEPVVLHRAQVGFWIGDTAELSGTTRILSLMAATQVQMLHVPSKAIRDLLENNPKYWQSFYRLATINTNIAVGLLAEALSLSLRARVCRRLLQLTELTPDVAVTQDDLAKMLGVYRSTVRPILNHLTESGAIRLGYRQISVLDRNQLLRFKDEQ